MKFTELRLAGAHLIELERFTDERGFFARAWCVREFRTAGMSFAPVQASLSFNRVFGTVRGMHYQCPPSREAKLVRCIRGRIFDVIVDIRPDSDTFLEYEAIELSDENRRALYIPAGFAHGFQSLEPDVEVFYEMTDYYQPELGRGFRPTDELVDIPWPEPISVLNERDASYLDVSRADFECFRGTWARQY